MGWGRLVRSLVIVSWVLSFSVTVWLTVVRSVLCGCLWLPWYSKEEMIVAVAFTAAMLSALLTIDEDEDEDETD